MVDAHPTSNPNKVNSSQRALGEMSSFCSKTSYGRAKFIPNLKGNSKNIELSQFASILSSKQTRNFYSTGLNFNINQENKLRIPPNNDIHTKSDFLRTSLSGSRLSEPKNSTLTVPNKSHQSHSNSVHRYFCTI